MLIKNIKVYTENKNFIDGEIEIEDGIFKRVSIGDNIGKGSIRKYEEILDGGGAYAIPGLIDLHFHGCRGYDICDGTEEAFAKIADYEAKAGITAICPATMTLPVGSLKHILTVAANYQKKALQQNLQGADLVGINMEGPFISYTKRGAQNPENIIHCDANICQSFIEASEGLVKFVGIAPEENENFEDFIEIMNDKVNISLAHTNANYETASRAFKAGANHVVHLYNGMTSYSHRAPGVIGAVADYKHVKSEIICDGIHVHPAAVRTTFQMMGEDRIILISDSIRACGMPDGKYLLGGLTVDVKEKYAVLSDGTLAGSVTNLMECLQNVVLKMGIPLEMAVACATMNPAKALGIYDKYGSISAGKKANLVLLDCNLNKKVVIKNGKVLCEI